MEFGIIAAGEGSRLLEEGFDKPKPMVSLQGEFLIDRLIRIFEENSAEKIHVIIPERAVELIEHLQKLSINHPIQLIIKNTPSSLHSFYELASAVTSSKFCLTTVDTVFKPETFKEYLKAFSYQKEADGLFGVTAFIDDEKPLYVSTNKELQILGFLDDGKAQYVSGGIYGMNRKAFGLVKKALETGMSRMRNFQRMLIEEGIHLVAFPFDKIVDIDHVTDISVAEDYLATVNPETLNK